MTVSLRGRLLLTTLLLVAAGLTAAGAVTYVALGSFLLDRVDEQLELAADSATADLRSGRELARDERFAYPHGTYAELRDDRGAVLRAFSATWGPPEAVGVSLPAGRPDGDDGGGGPRRTTVVSDSGAAYRALIQDEAVGSGAIGSVAVAVPLADLESTLARLLAVEVTVAMAVLAVVGLVGRWAIAVGLRPLGAIADTASAIAAGDLSRRVPRSDQRTEVGRLGDALNQMLTRIEEAFAQRTASEERLRRFVADASHELRTPLTAIRGHAELFRRGAAERPGDLATGMRRIEQESARMGGLVDDLLLLARLDEGRPLQRATVDLAETARDAVADARAAAPDRRVDLVAPGSALVLGDAAGLHQVAVNLLVNARVHTPPGTPVTVTVRRVDGVIVLEIADEGPGLPPDAASRVFERFYRVDTSRARASGGSGLGLSIVAAMVAAHGGRVDVSSSPGTGATFRVELPAAGTTAVPLGSRRSQPTASRP